MEFREPRHFREYRSLSESKADKILGPLFDLYALAVVGGAKPTHHWHWNSVEVPDTFQGYRIPGDPKAPVQHGELGFLWTESRWGWQNVRVIHPEPDWISQNGGFKWWQYAFSPEDRSYLGVCDIPIHADERVKVFNGRDDFWIFGIDGDRQEIPLVISEMVNRNDPRYKRLPFF